MDESRSDHIAIAEAALLLDTTDALVIVMLQKNELHGEMIDGIWHINRSSIDHAKSTELVATVGCGICGSGCGSGC